MIVHILNDHGVCFIRKHKSTDALLDRSDIIYYLVDIKELCRIYLEQQMEGQDYYFLQIKSSIICDLDTQLIASSNVNLHFK